MAGVVAAACYGKVPNLPSGHYQRHLDDILGFTLAKLKLYQLPVMGHRKADMSRSPFNLPIKSLMRP